MLLETPQEEPGIQIDPVGPGRRGVAGMAVKKGFSEVMTGKERKKDTGEPRSGHCLFRNPQKKGRWMSERDETPPPQKKPQKNPPLNGIAMEGCALRQRSFPGKTVRMTVEKGGTFTTMGQGMIDDKEDEF